MKQRRARVVQGDRWVAPFTGARIETYKGGEADVVYLVAPFTGARIETTTIMRNGCGRRRSPPSRGRGLKH